MAKGNEAGDPQNDETPAKSSTQDPACDQCRQRKVRCDRRTPRCTNCAKAKVPCGFSNRTKRVNHTKKLLSDFETLGKRLDRIEGAVSTMARINQSDTVNSLPTSGENSGAATPTFAGRNSLDGSNNIVPEQTMLLPTNARDSDQSFQIVKNGLEHFRGPSGMHAVYQDAALLTQGLLQDSPQKSSLNKKACCELDPNFESKIDIAGRFLDICDNDTKRDLHGDGLPLSYPPYTLLCTFVEPYLASVNKIWPIFHRNTLLNAIGAAYNSPDNVSDPAYMVIFNSVVLSVLTLNMKFHGPNGQNTLDETLLTSCLNNTRRCFDNFDKLLQNRLVNVQALTALSLVALTCFHFSTFEMVFASACQVARGVGLHQRYKGTNQETDEQDSQRIERCNLFWTLYTLDKRVPFISGTVCHLHIFDCDVPYLCFEPDEEINAYRIASSQLAELQEVVYKNLYSAEVGRLNQDQRNQRMKSTIDAIENWASNHRNFVDSEPTSLHHLELIYSLAVCRILVLRFYPDEQSKHARINHCRTALNTLKAMLSAPADLCRNVFLERVLVSCPLNPFLELYVNLIQPPPAEPLEDVNLLATYAEAIDFVPGRRFEVSHSHKVKTITTVLSSVAATVVTSRDPELASNSTLYALRSAVVPGSESPWSYDSQFTSSERSSLSSASSGINQGMSSVSNQVPPLYNTSPPSEPSFFKENDFSFGNFAQPTFSTNPSMIQPYDPSLNFVQGNDSPNFFDDLFFDMNLTKQSQT